MIFINDVNIFVYIQQNQNNTLILLLKIYRHSTFAHLMQPQLPFLLPWLFFLETADKTC